jgi:predicted hotdog family 3-hydroxylacyl-ACP dehydratase
MTGPLGDRLPQQGPARLLTELVRATESDASARAALGASIGYGTPRGIHALITVELLAQCAALTRSVPGAGGETPPGGRLAGVPRLDLSVDYLSPEAELTVSVRRTGAMGKLLSFEGRVTDEKGHLVAEGCVLIAEGNS